MTPRSAREWLDLVLDPGWELLFEDVVSGDPLDFPATDIDGQRRPCLTAPDAGAAERC